jgi:hypothetical protein
MNTMMIPMDHQFFIMFLCFVLGWWIWLGSCRSMSKSFSLKELLEVHIFDWWWFLTYNNTSILTIKKMKNMISKFMIINNEQTSSLTSHVGLFTTETWFHGWFPVHGIYGLNLLQLFGSKCQVYGCFYGYFYGIMIPFQWTYNYCYNMLELTYTDT